MDSRSLGSKMNAQPKILVCAPQSRPGDPSSMGIFFEDALEKLSAKGFITLPIGRSELFNADASSAVKVLRALKAPWLLIYWALVHSMWRRNARPQILVISQEYILPFAGGYQTAIIHDLIQYFFPRNNLARIFYRLYLPIFAKRLKKILCVSNTTRRMIKRILNLEAFAVCGVPIGKKCIQANGRHEWPRAFKAVWVGTCARHKQLGTFIQMCVKKPCHPSHKFAVVVPPSDRDKAQNLLRQLAPDASKFVICSALSDDQLLGLYQNSEHIVSTSSLEGFCMPILEASLVGTIPVAPNRTIFRENFGSFGILIPPNELTNYSFPPIGGPEIGNDLHEAVRNSALKVAGKVQRRHELAFTQAFE